MKIQLDSGIYQNFDEMDAESFQKMENTDEDCFKLRDFQQVYDESNIIIFFEKAIDRKSESEMKYLLERAFECRTTRNLFHRESSALMCKAIETGADTLIGPLVKYGARRHKLNSDGETDITLAIKHKRLEVLKELLKFKQTINSGNMKGYFPLLLAANEQFVEAFQLLMEAGANVNKKIGDIFLEAKENRGWRYRKVESLKGENVAHFLVRKMNSERKKNEVSPDNYIQMLLFILDSKKLCKAATNLDGYTVFDQLIKNQEEDVNVFKKLVQKKYPITLGAPISSACHLTPNVSEEVLQAIEEQIPEEELKRMVNGSEGEMLDNLFVACSCQNATILKWLLKRKADPNVSTSETLSRQKRMTLIGCGPYGISISAIQITPLHALVSWIRPSVKKLCDIQDTMKLLLKYGAKVDAAISTGTTPMGCILKIIAKSFDRDWEEDMAEELRKIVFLLLQAGANPDIYFEKVSDTETKILLGKVKDKIFMSVVMMLLETSTYLRLKSGLSKTEVNNHLSTISQFVPNSFIQRCINEPRGLVHLCRSVIVRKLEGRHLADPRKYLSMLPVPVQDNICLTYLHDQVWYDNQE